MKNGKDLIALDFFTVPTATFRVLFVLVMLTHSRRRLVHLNVTAHPRRRNGRRGNCSRRARWGRRRGI